MNKNNNFDFDKFYNEKFFVFLYKVMDEDDEFIKKVLDKLFNDAKLAKTATRVISIYKNVDNKKDSAKIGASYTFAAKFCAFYRYCVSYGERYIKDIKEYLKRTDEKQMKLDSIYYDTIENRILKNGGGMDDIIDAEIAISEKYNDNPGRLLMLFYEQERIVYENLK